MPSAIGKFVSVRFLALMAHFVILVTMQWSIDGSVRACLPYQFSQEEYNNQKSSLTIGLSIGIGLFGVEMISFLMGVSMFVTSVVLLSTLAHVIAAILLAFFILDSWECHSYWYVFGFCSAMPTFFEVITLALYLMGKRK